MFGFESLDTFVIQVGCLCELLLRKLMLDSELSDAIGELFANVLRHAPQYGEETVALTPHRCPIMLVTEGLTSLGTGATERPMAEIQNVPTNLKKCRHCAEPIQPEAKICSHCRKRQPLLNIIVSIAIVFVVLTLLATAHNKSVPAPVQPEPKQYIKTNHMIRWMTCLANQVDVAERSDLTLRVTDSPNRIVPEKGRMYELSGMRIIQKLGDGYLASADSSPEMVEDYQQPIVLYTDKELPREYMFLTGWASYEGNVEYTTIRGDTKRAYAFRLRDEEPWEITPYPHE